MFRLPSLPLDSTLPQRVKGCSPLTIPRKRSKPKNASRCAKRIFVHLSGTLPICCFAKIFSVSLERYRQRKRNTICEAVNSETKKKALSAATSFFRFEPWGSERGEQPLSRGSSVEIGGEFWFSFDIKENNSLTKSAARRKALVNLFWFSFGTQRELNQRNRALPFYYTPNPPDFCDQVPKASIFRPERHFARAESVLYFL